MTTLTERLPGALLRNQTQPEFAQGPDLGVRGDAWDEMGALGRSPSSPPSLPTHHCLMLPNGPAGSSGGSQHLKDIQSQTSAYDNMPRVPWQKKKSPPSPTA